MEYVVLLTPRVVKQLKKLPESEKERIKNKLKILKNKPKDKGQTLKPTRYLKIRVGDYRAIYKIQEKTRRAIILFIGHRSKVYDDFRKLE